MEAKVIELISEVLNTEVNSDSDKNNTENWDSLNHIRIILKLKEVFQKDIPSKDVDQLLSVKKIVGYLEL